MKNINRIIVLLSSLFVVVISGLALAGPANRSVASVNRLSDDSVVMGARAQLVRTDNGISMTINTEVEPGAYTNWWIIFNNPEECSNPLPDIGALCSPADFINPLVAGSVLYAAGNIVGPSWKGRFAGHLSLGDTGGALFGPGILNPMGAEVHVLVRSHGPIIPGDVPSQIHTVGGGCNPCIDRQAAAFTPL